MKCASTFVYMVLLCGIANSANAGWWHRHHYAAGYPVAVVPVASGFTVVQGNASSGTAMDEAALARAVEQALRANGFGAATSRPAAALAAGDSTSDQLEQALLALTLEVNKLPPQIAENTTAIQQIQANIATLQKDMGKVDALGKKVAQLQAQLPPKPSPVQQFLGSPKFKTMLDPLLKTPNITSDKVSEELLKGLSAPAAK